MTEETTISTESTPVSDLGDQYGLYMDCTYLINNKEIRKFVQDFISTRVPEYFQKIPAARNADHHMDSSLGEGGLVRHTLAMMAVLYDITNLKYLQFKQTDRDLIFAAAMLHDTFKHGHAGEKYERSHPNIAAQEILKFARERKQENIGKLIGGLVVAHMGEWGNQEPGNRGQFIVHLGDYIASRKYMSVSLNPLREALKAKEKELYTD